jgi:hypothetical protein
MKNGLGLAFAEINKFVGLENRLVGLKTLKTGRALEAPTLEVWAAAFRRLTV